WTGPEYCRTKCGSAAPCRRVRDRGSWRLRSGADGGVGRGLRVAEIRKVVLGNDLALVHQGHGHRQRPLDSVSPQRVTADLEVAHDHAPVDGLVSDRDALVDGSFNLELREDGGPTDARRLPRAWAVRNRA